MLSSLTHHIEKEQQLNSDIKCEAGAFRRARFDEFRHKQITEHLPDMAVHLPTVSADDSALLQTAMPVIVLTHIQKAAGNSVLAYLKRCVGSERVARIHEVENGTKDKNRRSCGEQIRSLRYAGWPTFLSIAELTCL